MQYKVLLDSPALYEFADEKTRLSIFDALVIRGKPTSYNFESILIIQKQESLSEKTAYVDSKPIECLDVGGKYFISKNIKDIFVKHQVNGEYFDTRVKIDNQFFEEDYYLFNPLVGIDCIDYKHSIYEKKYDKWDDLYDVSSFKKIKINENAITSMESLFFIETPNIVKSKIRLLPYIILIDDKLSQDLEKSDIRGLNVFDIGKYRYDWKWKDN